MKWHPGYTSYRVVRFHFWVSSLNSMSCLAQDLRSARHCRLRQTKASKGSWPWKDAGTLHVHPLRQPASYSNSPGAKETAMPCSTFGSACRSCPSNLPFILSQMQIYKQLKMQRPAPWCLLDVKKLLTWLHNLERGPKFVIYPLFQLVGHSCTGSQVHPCTCFAVSNHSLPRQVCCSFSSLIQPVFVHFIFNFYFSFSSAFMYVNKPVIKMVSTMLVFM